MSKRHLAFICSVAAVAVLAAACSDLSNSQPGIARLHSPVDASTLQVAKEAVARGDRVVYVGDWSRPDGVDLRSGGAAHVSREIAELFKANGVRVRVVGLAGSALAEIALNSAGCSVARNGQVVPHLPFVPSGTRAQDRVAELEGSRWWLEQGGADPKARADLVDRLERSPDKSWRMRTEDLTASGCAIE